MKILKSLPFGLLALVAALYLSLPSVSSASLTNITIDPNTGLPVTDVTLGMGGDYTVTGNFNFAVSDVMMFNSFANTNLPDPILAGFADYSRGNPGPVDITGFDYAVLHYSKGRGGSSQAGGIEIFYLNGMTGNFTFPEFGLGPNGRGRLSTLRLFASAPNNVPDGGSTVALLGVSLTGLALVRRFLTR